MLSQNMVINKVLSTKDMSIITLNGLTEKWFFNYKAEFLFLTNHYKKYNTVPDKVVFINTFPEFDLQEISEPDNYLLEQLNSDYMRSCFATHFNRLKGMFTAESDDDAMKAEVMALVEEMSTATAEVLSPTNIISDTSRYDRFLDRTSDTNSYYISTGFVELDKCIGGIDRLNENFVIAARTGIGKTQTLLKMAAEASKQGLRVGIFEGEMTADKVGYRIDTFLGNISNTAINRGQLYVQQEYKRYIDSLPSRNLGSIFVLTPTDMGGKPTVDKLKAFIEREKLDVLFVDQYSLLEDTSNARTSFERVGNIAREIKQLQVKYHIPIISVAQMNRTKNEDGSVDTSQIGLSDMIPQYATVLIMLERDKMDKTKLIMHITKARDGGDNQELVYNVDWDRGNFVYIPSGDSTATSEEEYKAIEDRYNTSWE